MQRVLLMSEGGNTPSTYSYENGILDPSQARERFSEYYYSINYQPFADKCRYSLTAGIFCATSDTSSCHIIFRMLGVLQKVNILKANIINAWLRQIQRTNLCIAYLC